MMGPAEFVFSQFAIGLMFNLGFYFPMGVPPAEEKPIMSQVAPAECIFYTTWSGVAAPDSSSDNNTEKLLAEAEIQRALNTLETTVVGFLKSQADREGDEMMALMADLGPKWLKHVLMHPAAIYLESVEPGPGPPSINAGVILDLADNRDEFVAMLEKLQKQGLGDAVKTVEIGDHKFYQIKVQPTAPLLTWGTRGRYLLATLGEEGVEKMVANVTRNRENGLPTWLEDTRKQLAIDRFSTVTYVDVAKIMEQALPLGGPMAAHVVETLGLDNITSYTATTGLDKTGFVNRSLVSVDGELKGLLKIADGQPFKPEDVNRIPFDTPIAISWRLDTAELFDTFVDIVKGFDEDSAAEMREGLRFASRAIGFDIRDELLASLGDQWTIYSSPSDGGLITGWTATVSIRDRMTIEKAHHILIGFLRGSFGDGHREPQIKRKRFGDHEFYYLSVPDDDMPIVPTWSVTRDEVVFGLFPQAVKSHLTRSQQDKSLADRPQVAKLLDHENGPVALTYVDSKKLIEIVYPLLQFGAQFAVNQAQQSGMDLDISILPSLSSIQPHLEPTVQGMYRTKDGIESTSHQTVPSGNVASSAPIMVALLLPAVQGARTAARRTQSMNNMKQIGIALHNHHDVYKAFPAAYSTDKDGKPLLSWRVHILPFVEEGALYEEFHLDEPWDSEHNIKLLDRMPITYRSPASAAPPNKTTYLGIGGEGGSFLPPGMRAAVWGEKGKVAGTSLAQMTDGTSNTIIIVEANDELAVEWTKPVEFKPNAMDPAKGIPGMFPQGFNALFGDASVRFIPETIDREVLQNLFQRNDGNLVEIP